MKLKSGVTLDQSVYIRIKEMIINKELPPGQLIVQNQLSQSLGVSRTPLRVALTELESEGLLVRSSKGWVVKEFTIQDMISVLEIRAVLEGLVCRSVVHKIEDADLAYMKTLFTDAYKLVDQYQAEAYYKADIKFHNMIVDINGDQILKRTIHSNRILTTSHIQGLYRDPKETFEEHMAIIDTLKARDGIRAEVLMREHIQNSAEALRTGNYSYYK